MLHCKLQYEIIRSELMPYRGFMVFVIVLWIGCMLLTLKRIQVMYR